MIELTERHILKPHIRFALIVRDAHAAVAADHRMIRVRGVYPHRMKVNVDLLCAVIAKSLAAIIRDVQLDAEHINALVVIRVNANLTEVHRARVGVAHLRPGCPGIFRTIHATLFRVFDSGINNVRIAAIYIEPNAALGAFGNALGEFRPRAPGICGFINRASDAASVKTPGRAAALIGRRVNDFVIRRIHHQFGRASVRICL
jgi:hypothetical protein